MTGMSMEDFLQFRVLPLGSFLIPVTGIALWRLRGRVTRKAVFFIATMGIVGGAALVATLRALFLLPRLVACLDCGLLGRWWYSDAITFVQGFGAASTLALSVHWLTFRSRR